MSAHAPLHMRRREKRVGSLHAGTMAKSFVGAGVAVAVPATGALVASASAEAAGASAMKASPLKSAATPRLAYGSSGSAVRTLQSRLGIAADGVFGPATAAAVKRFQGSHGLMADGVVGPLTWAKLGGSAAGSSASTKTSPAKSTTPRGTCVSTGAAIRYGSSGQLVKVLQSRLGLGADGFFGPMTRQAVMRFQSQHGLVADGVVGQMTWSKLGCSGSVATKPATTKPSRSTAPTGRASGAAAVAMAKRYVGVPYVWGGMTPAGFDCSGLTSYVFKQFGIYIPRTAAQQQAYFRSVSTPQVGDLIFYGQPAYHVAIYVGNGLMIDAAHPGAFVAVRSIYGAPSGYARAV